MAAFDASGGVEHQDGRRGYHGAVEELDFLSNAVVLEAEVG